MEQKIIDRMRADQERLKVLLGNKGYRHAIEPFKKSILLIVAEQHVTKAKAFEMIAEEQGATKDRTALAIIGSALFELYMEDAAAELAAKELVNVKVMSGTSSV